MDVDQSLPFLILNSRPQRPLRRNRRGLALEQSRKRKLAMITSAFAQKTDNTCKPKTVYCSSESIGLSEMDKLQARSRDANAKKLLQKDNAKVNMVNSKSKLEDVVTKTTGVPNKRIKLSPLSPAKPLNKSPPVYNTVNKKLVPSSTGLTPMVRRIKLNRASIGL